MRKAFCTYLHILLIGSLYMYTAPDQVLFSQTRTTDSTQVWQELLRDRNDQYFLKKQWAVINPVLLQTDQFGEYTHLRLYMDLEEKNVYHPQLGNGTTTYGSEAKGFRRLGDRQSVWGKAYYTKQYLKNIVWNETSDLERVYPYVTADSVGGNLDAETYYLEGGYNLTTGKQVWGFSGAYRASSQYRELDPRPHNTVSDLRIRIGTSRPIGNYRTAIGYVFEHYTQNNSVRIANPISGPSFYHLIGMGMDQKLLWGRNNETYYLGRSHRLDIQTQPVKEDGWYGRISLVDQYIDKSITTLRSLLSSYADSRSIEGLLAYRLNRGESAWSPSVGYVWYERQGNSFLFDTQGNNTFVKVGEIQDFDHYYAQWTASLDYYHPLNPFLAVKAAPMFGYRTEEMDYRKGQRKWDFHKLHWGLNMFLLKTQHKKQIWDIQAGFAKAQVNDKHFILNQPLESTGLEQMVRQQYVYQTSPYIEYKVNGQYYHSLSKNYAGILGVMGSLKHYPSLGHNLTLSLSIGVAL